MEKRKEFKAVKALEKELKDAKAREIEVAVLADVIRILTNSLPE